MNNKITALLLSLVLICGSLAACSDDSGAKTPGDAQTTAETTASAQTETAESYDGKLVFDHTMELSYAKCFSVDYYKGGYKLISIIDGTKLLIVPENMSVPADTDSETIVLQQPISNILVSSTPTTSLINAIGALGSVSLTTYDVDSWYIDSVKDALTSGKMTYIGNYKEPDYELITASGCDFAIFSTMLTEDVAEQLSKLGVRILLDQAAEEEHPLARVEWMKLYGAMFNLEDAAEKLVNEQIAYVDEISKLEATGKSVAIFYITSKGALYARNADDYMAKMAELAG
ncbi:MAG: ABC transporter substrate-binding protein, partial [Eubacteriales bacterium]